MNEDFWITARNIADSPIGKTIIVIFMLIMVIIISYTTNNKKD